MKLRAALRPRGSPALSLAVSPSSMGGFPAARCTSASCRLGVRRGSGEMRALQPQGTEPCGRTMEGWADPKWSWSQMEPGKAGSCFVSTSPELPRWESRQWSTDGPDIPCTALFPLASRWVGGGRRGAARLREVRRPKKRRLSRRGSEPGAAIGAAPTLPSRPSPVLRIGAERGSSSAGPPGANPYKRVVSTLLSG